MPVDVPADASGEHTMFPWKNPPARSPPRFLTALPITSAPLTPGFSGSPIHVSIKTKFNQDSTAAIIMAMISFNLIPPFEVWVRVFLRKYLAKIAVRLHPPQCN